jgi:porin
MKTRLIRLRLRSGAAALALVLAFALAREGIAQEPVAEAPADTQAAAAAGSPFGTGLLSGPRWSKEPLTGDWFGARSWLADQGLTFGINVVNTVQGVLDGGRDRDWDNGGSLYIESQFSSDRAGLWPGGFVDFRLERQYGDFVNAEAGSFPAVNMLGIFPEPDQGSFVVSKLMATQFVAKWLGFFIGRFDTADGDTNNLASGRGRTGFLNPQLAFSPNSALTTPYVMNGLGAIAFTPNPFLQRPASLSLIFADPQGDPDDSGLNDDFFDEQYYAAEWRFPTRFFGLPGSQNVSYNYNTKEFLQLDDLTKQFITRKKSSDSGAGVFAYNFHQYVYVEPGQDTESTGYDADQERLQGFGVFGRVGYSDADVNPIEWSFALGVAGRGMIPSRDDDTFGIAPYWGKISRGVSDVSDSLNKGYFGFETYYDFAVTPWLHFAPNFQVTEPILDGEDTAYVLGFRAKVDL